MPLTEALPAQTPSHGQSSATEGPMAYLERICGFRRFEPAKKIGFRDGVKNLATKTRSFFGGLFSPEKRR